MTNKRHTKKIWEYNAIFEEEEDGKGYCAWVPELPGCASQGETFEEALHNIKEAMELYLDVIREEKTDEDITPSEGKKYIVPVQVYA